MRILREIFRPDPGEAAAPAIMGVCSYIANRFKLDVLAVRVSFIALAYLGPSATKVMLAYIVAGIVLSISGDESKRRRRKKRKVKMNIDIDAQSSYKKTKNGGGNVEIESEENILRYQNSHVHP